MKEKYDVGIFGLWYGRNYGSIITYYALNCVLKSMGFSTVMIRNPLSTDNTDTDTLPLSHPYRLAKEKYNLAPFYKLNEMNQLNELCKSFLVGSDQMWNYHLSKPYQQSYFLDFADDNKIKISYATSFGKYPYNGPDAEKSEIKKNLSRMTGISVRDDFSKEIINSDFHLNAEQVVDSVFLCNIEEYKKLINEDKTFDFQDYIFAYILDPNPDMGKIVLELAKDKKVIVAFNELSNLNECRLKLNAEHDNVIFIEKLPIGTWLKCYANSDFVLTDSFHGTCFSVIFEKPFYVVKNKNRGSKRFDCLLNMLDLNSQMAADYSELTEKLNKTGTDFVIDYNNVHNHLDYHKKYSYKWLNNMLNGKNEKITVDTRFPVNYSVNMKYCTGCGACVNICPVNALKLSPDKYGYYKPKLLADKCIECGNCTNTCPALHLPQKENSASPDLYAFIAKDNEVLKESSSGGIFSILAEKVLAKGGCVAGAAWTNDFSVTHILINTAEELAKLRKSKYMQSYVCTIYRTVKEKLEQNKPVLFSGCPCQAAALRSYLGMNYENLLIVDLLCGNAPSSDFFKRYIHDKQQSGVTEYKFRHKDDICDWNAFTVQMKKADGQIEIRKRIRDDDYQRVYHNHIMCPEHCEHCIYQALPRYGDITIGDFWGISKLDPHIQTEKGVSAILCNNLKADKWLKMIDEKDFAVMKKVPLNWLGGNGYAVTGKNFALPKRDVFYSLINEHDFSEAVNMTLKPYYQDMRKNEIETKQIQAMFSAKMSHFRFDPAIWQQHFTANSIVLSVPAGKSPPNIQKQID